MLFGGRGALPMTWFISEFAVLGPLRLGLEPLLASASLEFNFVCMV